MSTFLRSWFIILYLVFGFSGIAEAMQSVLIGDKEISTETYHIYEFHGVEISNGEKIRLEFLNNLFGGSGKDQNIYVDYVEIDDLAGTVIRLEAEGPSVNKSFSDHVISDLDASGTLSYAMLNNNERLSFRFTGGN